MNTRPWFVDERNHPNPSFEKEGRAPFPLPWLNRAINKAVRTI